MNFLPQLGPEEVAVADAMRSASINMERAIARAYRAGVAEGRRLGQDELRDKVLKLLGSASAAALAVDRPLDAIERNLQGSQAKASTDNGSYQARFEGHAVAGDASRLDAGRTASATSERMDVTAGETATVSDASSVHTSPVQDEGGEQKTGDDAAAGAEEAGITAGQSSSFVGLSGAGEDVGASSDPAPAADISTVLPSRSVPRQRLSGRDNAGIFIRIDTETRIVTGSNGQCWQTDARTISMLARMLSGQMFGHDVLRTAGGWRDEKEFIGALPMIRFGLKGIGITLHETKGIGLLIKRTAA